MKRQRIPVIVAVLIAIGVVIFNRQAQKPPTDRKSAGGELSSSREPSSRRDRTARDETATGDAQYFHDHKERWPVKTGSDDDVSQVNATPANRFVRDLIQIEAPDGLTAQDARAHRLSDPERTIYTIDADIIRWKFERDDHDFHMVIRDHGDTEADEPSSGPAGHRRTMIVEAADPDVVLPGSPWLDQIRAARNTAADRLRPGGSFTRRVIHARITGVGFFDFDHGQSGRSPNGMELHPILKFEWMDD